MLNLGLGAGYQDQNIEWGRVWWSLVRGLAIIHSQTEGCACAEVDVHSGRLWIDLFATGLSTETLGFTSSDFR